MTGDQIAQGPRCQTHDAMSCPPNRTAGVGYAAVGAELECFGGQLFGLDRRPRDLRLDGTLELMPPAQNGWSS